MARKRLQEKRTNPQPSEVVTIHVHPLAWKRALKLAGGDAKRLVRLNESSVLVLRK